MLSKLVSQGEDGQYTLTAAGQTLSGMLCLFCFVVWMYWPKDISYKGEVEVVGPLAEIVQVISCDKNLDCLVKNLRPRPIDVYPHVTANCYSKTGVKLRDGLIHITLDPGETGKTALCGGGFKDVAKVKLFLTRPT